VAAPSHPRVAVQQTPLGQSPIGYRLSPCFCLCEKSTRAISTICHLFPLESITFIAPYL
jgi:hypothetical protein